ncbi:MAG: hypothetical protein AB7G93_19800 [Bdellovibrionales bacterium]
MSVICSVDDQKTEGYVLRRDLSRHERLLRAGKMLGLLWLVMFFTVFVPILHFVLVPLFFVLGLVFAFTSWMETGEVISGEITCPNCQKLMELSRESEQWPKTQRCTGCSFTLQVTPRSPPVQDE